MQRFFDLNTLSDRNYVDILDPSYMRAIPDDGKCYKIVNNEIVEDFEKEILQIKELKFKENTQKRDSRLINGVTYKNVLFDSDTDQKVNLMFAANSMGDKDKIIWFGMNNESLECNKQDLINIAVLISDLTSKIWAELNPKYIAEINEAKTVEEVNSIDIDYSQL